MHIYENCNMDQGSLSDILRMHGLRVTENRLQVLNFFLKHDRALTIRDLEEAFSRSDRVTLYRTLNSFTEKGVLHRIPDDSGFSTYGVCHDTCAPHEHHHEHIHFKCERCGNIECIDRHLPNIRIPGYAIHETQVIVNGICPNCREN